MSLLNLVDPDIRTVQDAIWTRDKPIPVARKANEHWRKFADQSRHDTRTDSLSSMARSSWKRHKSPGYDEAADPSVDEKFERVREVLSPTGSSSGLLSMDVRPVSVRRDGGSALFIFEAEGEAKPLALRIDLEPTSEEFYYEGTVESFDEWLADLPVYVSVSIGTGVVARAGRIDRGDFIELVGA